VVYEIHDDGAIAKDDRLLCGDQILEVRLCACSMYATDVMSLSVAVATRFYRLRKTLSLNVVLFFFCDFDMNLKWIVLKHRYMIQYNVLAVILLFHLLCLKISKFRFA